MAIPVLPVSLAADGRWEADDAVVQTPGDIATVESLDHFSKTTARVRVGEEEVELVVYRSSDVEGYIRLADV